MSSNKIKYLPLGDSYTIGEGVPFSESFPSQVTNLLNKSEKKVDLVGNPAKTGWTTKDLMEKELPIFDQLKPDFSTLLIGVNDWVQGYPLEIFRQNLGFIIHHIQHGLPHKGNLVLLTIPDFSLTPVGPKYSGGRNITAGLQEFNQVIKQLAEEKQLPVVDIFMLSLRVRNDISLVAADGLHPSGKAYTDWAENIVLAIQRLPIFSKK
ncbi:MAG: SGNH/GDSL hydrolase family protein [Cytophagales bacterium]|nr:SGNH/GDSL hydrolase family protein [Cytophagales bacterium]